MNDVGWLAETLLVDSRVRPLTDADREIMRNTDDAAGLLRLRDAVPSHVSRRAQVAGELATYAFGLAFIAFMLITSPNAPIGGVFLLLGAMVGAMYWTIFLKRRTRQREAVVALWQGNIDFNLERLAADA